MNEHIKDQILIDDGGAGDANELKNAETILLENTITDDKEITNNELNNRVKNILEHIIISSPLLETNKSELQIHCCEALADIYNNNEEFRHDYFAIFQCISRIEGNSETFDAINTDIVGMRKIVQEGQYSIGQKKKFEKFFQYTQMELLRTKKNYDDISRINSITEKFESASENLEKATKNIADLENKITHFETRVKDAESGYLSNLLSTLGLFAGVIIAFFGGLELLISVFNNINAISKYRLVFMGLIVGFLIFNIIAVMMVLLGRMIGKEIYKECNGDSCKECKKKLFPFFQKIKNRLPYIYYVDTILIALMGIVFVLWLFSNKVQMPL